MVVVVAADGTLHGFDLRSGEPTFVLSHWGPIAHATPIFDDDDMSGGQRSEAETSAYNNQRNAANEQGSGYFSRPSTSESSALASGAGHGRGAGAEGGRVGQEAGTYEVAPRLIPSYEPGGGLYMVRHQWRRASEGERDEERRRRTKERG